MSVRSDRTLVGGLEAVRYMVGSRRQPSRVPLAGLLARPLMPNSGRCRTGYPCIDTDDYSGSQLDQRWVGVIVEEKVEATSLGE